LATSDAPLFGAALTSPISVSQFSSEFDTFLYASVEERSDGPMLSVLSALARLDIDPWQEAAKLARMTRDKAVCRMAALIESLPGDCSTHMNSKAIATRLIALLPRQIVITVIGPGPTPPAGNFANVHVVMAFIVLNVLLMALAFGGQYLTGSRPPATPPSQTRSSVVSKLNPDVPAPHVGK
jgi:hypothetical protein